MTQTSVLGGLIVISGGCRISPRREHQLPGGGTPTYDFAKFSPKLHQIERIWTPGRDARPLRPPPLDPLLVMMLTGIARPGFDSPLRHRIFFRTLIVTYSAHCYSNIDLTWRALFLLTTAGKLV